jgi:hypothetical protein
MQENAQSIVGLVIEFETTIELDDFAIHRLTAAPLCWNASSEEMASIRHLWRLGGTAVPGLTFWIPEA